MTELKSKLELIVTKNGKNFVFSCENGTDLSEAYSACWEMGKWFLEKLNEAQKNIEPKVENEEKKEN